MADPNYITVDTEHTAEVEADYCHVYITITSSSTVLAGMSSKRAKEVLELQERLIELGVPEKDFEVISVRGSVEKTGLVKASNVSYQIRVRVDDLKRLSTIAGVVLETNHANLYDIRWGHSHLPELRLDWLRTCLAESRNRASIITEGLGLRLAGVYRCYEKIERDAEESYRSTMGVMVMKKRYRETEELDLPELPLRHASRFTLKVSVSYLVEPV